MDKSLKKEILFLSLGEAAVAILTVLGFLAVHFIASEREIFDYTVVTGAALGAVTVIINFLILSLSTTRAINAYVAEIGDRVLTEEEAEEFARAHKAKVQLAFTRSYLIRTATTFGVLVLAFVLEWFNPIAAAIPLLMYKPVLYVIQLIKRKGGKC